MRIILLFIFLTFNATQIQSRPYTPALFDVANVASDDMLNVRESPDAASPIVGALAYDTKSVEVVTLSEDGEWGLVNSDEHSIGWVLLRFMTQTAPDPVATDFERDLWCFGDEPHWTLYSRAKAGITLSNRGTDIELTRTFAPLLAWNRGFERQVMMAKSDGIEITATLSPALCRSNEGVYGFGLDLLKIDGDSRWFVSGCCSLSTRGQ